MEQQNCLQEIMESENPLQGGNNLKGVKVSEKNFEAIRKGLNRQKRKMTLKPGKISCRFKVISSIVITLNLEFNSMCWKKKHSLFHWNTLTWPGFLIEIWMCWKKKRKDDSWNVDANRSLSDSWKGFTKFTLLKETSKEKNVVREETDENSTTYQTWEFLAWRLV